ncbi:hypothetical protein Tco_0697627 [Tanacetum coccineum]
MSEQKAPGVSATTRPGGSSTNNTKTRGRSVQYQLNTKAKSISDADKRAKKSNVESIKEDVPQAKAPSLRAIRWPYGNLKGRITHRVVPISGLGQTMKRSTYRCGFCVTV